MKIFSLFLSVLILFLPFQSEILNAQEQTKIRVAVFDFDGKGIDDSPHSIAGREEVAQRRLDGRDIRSVPV